MSTCCTEFREEFIKTTEPQKWTYNVDFVGLRDVRLQLYMLGRYSICSGNSTSDATFTGELLALTVEMSVLSVLFTLRQSMTRTVSNICFITHAPSSFHRCLTRSAHLINISNVIFARLALSSLLGNAQIFMLSASYYLILPLISLHSFKADSVTHQIRPDSSLTQRCILVKPLLLAPPGMCHRVFCAMSLCAFMM